MIDITPSVNDNREAALYIATSSMIHDGKQCIVRIDDDALDIIVRSSRVDGAKRAWRVTWSNTVTICESLRECLDCLESFLNLSDQHLQTA